MSIVNTLRCDIIYVRSFEDIRVDTETIAVGNNSVTARCRIYGQEGEWMLKCYHRVKANSEMIYGSAYYRGELGIYTLAGRMEYIDVLLIPWVEGVPLDVLMGSVEADYRALSATFDASALQLLNSYYAHGDLKPENIIVQPDGEMSLIDYDAAWLPHFKNCNIEEYGTPSYSHPRRYLHPFDKCIDDFSIALLSVTLAALAIDREGFEPQLKDDSTLFLPEDVLRGEDVLFNRAIELFECSGDTAHRDIACSLKNNDGAITHLRDMLMRVVPTEHRLVPHPLAFLTPLS